jgi:CubicO group peptidase (beta-lactamase class C family)
VPVDVGMARLQADGPAALLAPLAGPDVVVPDQPALKAVLDRAFAEPADGIRNRTKAVVVVRDGKIIAERYAPGIGVDTPLMGYSLAKSFVNAMVGVLVRQGRLRVSDPAPIAAWHRPGDARGAITIENLMRMTTGLDFNDDHTGFDRSSELICLRHDKAAFGARSALRVAPGTHWAYSSPSSVMLSRIVGDTVGGTPHDLAAFAWHELFNPLGMRHVTLEFDGAGTFIGSTYMFASARDWARLGLLYANDGIIGGRRLLPPGWVAFSTRRTLYSGYGAGFWRDESLPPVVSTEGGAPQVTSGAFHGIGHAGQVITVLPGDRLVIVRLADTVGQNDEVAARKRLMTDVLAAVSH